MINKILKVIKENKGIITSSQIEAHGIARTYLSQMVEKGIIERIDRGIYVTKDYKYDYKMLFEDKKLKIKT